MSATRDLLQAQLDGPRLRMTLQLRAALHDEDAELEPLVGAGAELAQRDGQLQHRSRFARARASAPAPSPSPSRTHGDQAAARPSLRTR